MRLNAYNQYAERFEILRENAFFSEIIAVDHSVEVQNVENSELKMSLRGAFFQVPDKINLLTDRLRPLMIINGTEYPLGKYVVTTETRISANGVEQIEIEAYSLLYLAKRKKIEERLSISAGDNYISFIMSLLNQCGIKDIDAEQSSLTFSTAREDWDIGTPYLDIINQLLTEINYNTAWVDLNGTVRLTKYTAPRVSDILHCYSADEYSIIESNHSRTTDRYGKSNVFRVTCENPEHKEPMVAIAENNSPDSPYSTVNIGRILHSERVNNIPDQETLQNYANRLRDQSLQETETVEFYTAIAPTHTSHDVVALDSGTLTGIYVETEWTLPMSPGASMTHKARRILYAG